MTWFTWTAEVVLPKSNSQSRTIRVWPLLAQTERTANIVMKACLADKPIWMQVVLEGLNPKNLIRKASKKSPYLRRCPIIRRPSIRKEFPIKSPKEVFQGVLSEKVRLYSRNDPSIAIMVKVYPGNFVNEGLCANSGNWISTIPKSREHAIHWNRSKEHSS